MDILGNKMFSYIDKASELTQDMVNQYNTSLIVLGDEKQIFVPVINSYVGIGQSAYNYILSKLRSTDDNFEEYNKYIHNDTVTSIFAQYSPDEIENAFDNDSSQNPTVTINGTQYSERGVARYITKANKNVVIKGSNAYTALNGNINSNVQSGISVSIAHTGQLKTGNYELNGQIYSYTYYDPYDTITVDDTKTWSYITASNTYIVDFVTKFSTQQANRVYRNLLGEDDVFIEKTFDEAFNYDSGINQLVEFEPVYVKFNHNINETPFAQVTVENTNNGYRITVNDENNNTYIIYSTIQGDTIATISDILASEDDGGYISTTSTTNPYIPVWYHKEDEGTKREPNIADGIQTLKEVAYILDRITDGTDTGNDGISLAYNIAQNYRDIKDLQAWKNQIGNETVSSFTSESDTDLLTVHYYSMNSWTGDGEKAVGEVKLDLGLSLAQTYIVDGVTYAAYLVSGQVPNEYTTYFVKHEDTTNLDNYISLRNDANAGQSFGDLKTLLQKQDPSITDTTDLTLWTIQDGIREQYGTVQYGNLTYLDADYYIYFPYSEANYVFNTGLTDVKWVTTYVGWTAYNIVSKINEVNTDLNDLIQTKLDNLDVPDYSYSYLGQFVTKVEEIDGKIIVTKEKLPLDTIIKNDINTTAETFIHISVAQAKAFKDRNPSIPFYTYDTLSGYTEVQNDTLDDYDDNDCSRYYAKITLNDMKSVTVDTTVNELLTNGGNFTYFYKKSINNIDNYLPLDIQGENKTGGKLANGKVNNADEIYYLDGNLTNTKYFDVSTVHQKNGSTTTVFTSYITPIAAATPSNTGLVDAYDVRRTIESMFKWVNIKTNTVIE